MSRTSWVFRSRLRTEYLELPVNPTGVEIVATKRMAELGGGQGTTFFFGTNPDGTFDDVTRLTVNGSSGNLIGPTDPEGPFEEQEAADVSARMLSFQKLWRLSRDPIRLDDGSKNWVSIWMNYPLLGEGSSCFVEGFFSESLRVQADSGNPRKLQYSFGFVVISELNLYGPRIRETA